MTGGPLEKPEDVEIQPDICGVSGTTCSTFETKRRRQICVKGRAFGDPRTVPRLRSELGLCRVKGLR